MSSLVRFLDGDEAGTATIVYDEIREGRHYFHGSELTTSRDGAPYHLKPVPREEWARADLPEWAAARDQIRS